jgi:hypothetical protein
MICRSCHHPIHKGQSEDLLEGVHKYAEDCVAATEAATAGKCAEIAEAQSKEEFERINPHGIEPPWKVAIKIRRAFPKAFAQEEGK